MSDLASWVGAGVVAAFVWGAGHIIGNATAVEPVSLALVSLEFEDGKFTQEHQVTGVDVLQADWTAQIVRGNRPLCGGGGQAPYGMGVSLAMTPNEWTNAVCPVLKSGDRAIASWSWVGTDNIRRRISGELVIP